MLSRLGYNLKPYSLSSYRIEAEVKHGKSFDVVVGVPRAVDRPLFYSKSFVSYENVVIGFKSRKMSLKSVNDLKGLRVGTWVNGWKELGKDFAREFAPRSSGATSDKYVEFANQGLQVRALWDEDIDVMIMDRYIFGWFRVTLGSLLDVSRDVEFFPLFAVPNHSYVAFRDQKIRKAFDRELLKMRKSGEYEQIVQRYVGEKIAAMFKTSGKTH